MGWDDGRRKRSSRTHRGPRATRGIGRVVSIIFDREGGRGRRRGGRTTYRRVVFLPSSLLVGRTIHTVSQISRPKASSSMRYRRRRRPRRFLLGSVNDSRHRRRRARGSRARCPPRRRRPEGRAMVTWTSCPPPGWMRSRRGSVRAHVHPRACLKRSAAAPPSDGTRSPLPRPPPSLPSLQSTMIGARASTACARSPRRSNLPPAPDPDAHPASSAATADDAALDDSLEATPTRPPRTRPRTRPQTTLLPRPL